MNEVIKKLFETYQRRKLRNRYFAGRHLRSRANEQGVIVSTEEEGIKPEWGIVPGGSIVLGHSMQVLDEYGGTWVVASSRFTRHIETAELITEMLRAGGDIVRLLDPMPEFNERAFGDFEGQSAVHYETVWAQDKQDPHHSIAGVESVIAVRNRMLDGIIKIEMKNADCNVIIVSSADPLRILQTAFEDRDPSEHRALSPFENGEIRPLDVR